MGSTMRLELTGRRVEITPALRRLVDAKCAKLDRLLNDGAVSAQVVLTAGKRLRRADITLHARGERFLHGVGEDPNWGPAIGEAVDRIAQQAQTMKGKWNERKRRPLRRSKAPAGVAQTPAAKRPAPSPERSRPARVVRASRQAVKPMSVAEAAGQVEATGSGFVVFLDTETGGVNVLFRRHDGALTLVEIEP
jgi:putative sigma-54 modulation protein